MEDVKIVAGVVNILYFIIWFCCIKLRNSKFSFIREWDNGNAFYETLCEEDKESYWKEDTLHLQFFFVILLVFMEFTLYLWAYKQDTWGIPLIVWVVLSSIVYTILSMKSRRVYTAKKH